MLDLSVLVNNFTFLVVQGLLGLGGFTGGTLRLAIPAIALGFVLGIFVGLARLARARAISLPATLYVEFFRGVPLVMVMNGARGVQTGPRGRAGQGAWDHAARVHCPAATGLHPGTRRPSRARGASPVEPCPARPLGPGAARRVGALHTTSTTSH